MGERKYDPTFFDGILYVPFNHDYVVNEKIRNALTEDEFFEHCFFMPDFDKEIHELQAVSEEEKRAFEIDITTTELIEKYDKMKTDSRNFYKWIDANQNDIFCVKGDAGTGKSTFLHYLQYTQRQEGIIWEIIDIQKAISEIKMLGHAVKFPRFETLYSKATATLCKGIYDRMFAASIRERNRNFGENICYIQNVCKGFDKLCEELIADERVEGFFASLSQCVKNVENERTSVKECARVLSEFTESEIKRDDSLGSAFAIFVELFVVLLRCENREVRYMIAFDNFERFIGTDEIYNRQLTEFVVAMRRIQNVISENFRALSWSFQIVIFMRNTSTRMFTSQQVSELFPHRIEMSAWFQMSKIVKKKVKWYEDHQIEIGDSSRFEGILNDIGYCNGEFRGLRSKLNQLFNNNKRLITLFLEKVMTNPINDWYLDKYDNFYQNVYGMEKSCAKFAARTIMFRLVLNALREDEFFKVIMAQSNNSEKTSLGYARKILTILYEHKLANGEDVDTYYMSFEDLIRKLFPDYKTSVTRYFNDNNKSKRRTIAQILFYMNYYDGTANSWLQFIDIQYNLSESENVRIDKHEELFHLIDKSYRDMKVRITEAGIAYLFSVVYTFDFFACKSRDMKRKKNAYGVGDMPPLLCLIPTQNDIMNESVSNLPCYKEIRAVADEAFACMTVMDRDDNSIDFRKTLTSTPISHKRRIINAHIGHIDNFLDCVKSMYEERINTDEIFEQRFNVFKTEIEGVRDEYRMRIKSMESR